MHIHVVTIESHSCCPGGAIARLRTPSGVWTRKSTVSLHSQYARCFWNPGTAREMWYYISCCRNYFFGFWRVKWRDWLTGIRTDRRKKNEDNTHPTWNKQFSYQNSPPHFFPPQDRYELFFPITSNCSVDSHLTPAEESYEQSLPAGHDSDDRTR